MTMAGMTTIFRCIVANCDRREEHMARFDSMSAHLNECQLAAANGRHGCHSHSPDLHSHSAGLPPFLGRPFYSSLSLSPLSLLFISFLFLFPLSLSLPLFLHSASRKKKKERACRLRSIILAPSHPPHYLSSSSRYISPHKLHHAERIL